MSRPKVLKMPLGPLLQSTGLDGATVECTGHFGGGAGKYDTAAPQTVLAQLIGQTLRTVSRWANEGIPLGSAEDVAFQLGTHPAFVWGDDWIFAAGCPLAKVVAHLSVAALQGEGDAR